MRIEFNDSTYRFEHGKAPKGYGMWAFEFEGYMDWESGTLAEAKKKCKECIKKVAPKDYAGTVIVTILP